MNLTDRWGRSLKSPWVSHAGELLGIVSVTGRNNWLASIQTTHSVCLSLSLFPSHTLFLSQPAAMRDVSVHNWGFVVSCAMLACPEVFQDKSLAVVLIDRPRLYMGLQSMSQALVNVGPPPNGAFSSPHPQRSLMRLRLPHGPSQLDLFDQIHMILATLQCLGSWQARSLSLVLSL